MPAVPLLLSVLLSAQPPTDDSSVIAWRQPDPSTLKPVFGARWKAELGSFELLSTNHEEWTRPVLSPDGARVYIGTRDGVLQARSMTDGALLWKRERLGAIGADMLEYEQTVVVGSDSDLVAFQRDSGEERWRVEIGGRIGGGITRTGTVAIIPVRPNAFVAVDIRAGQRLWQVKRPTPDGLTVRGQARPSVDRARNIVYLGFSDGALLAATLDGGTTQWVAALGDPGEFFADVDASPIRLNGGRSLLVAAYNTALFRLDAGTGAIEWSRPIPRIMALLSSGPGIAVASQGEGQVLGIQPDKGRVVWRYRMEEGAPSPPRLLDGGLIAVSSSRGPLSILSATNGRPIQLVAPGTGSSVPPAAEGPYLVLFSNGGLVLGMRRGTSGGVILR